MDSKQFSYFILGFVIGSLLMSIINVIFWQIVIKYLK